MAFTASAGTCPGSAAFIHAKCQLELDVHASCDDFTTEVTARMNGEGGWADPHNGGTYNVLSSKDGVIQGTRLTGNQKYQDLFTFTTTPSADGSSCAVTACSESQVFSVIDMSTNYCNLHVLYCGSEDNCAYVHKQLDYKETLSSCSQHDVSKCIVTPSANSATDTVELVAQQPILGASSDNMCTLYKIDGDECGQSTLDCKFSSPAKKFAGLSDGDCASQGYTVAAGTQTLHVPFITTVTVSKFTKPTSSSTVQLFSTQPTSTASSSSALSVDESSDDCPTIQTQPDFDLDTYIQGRWYIAQQAVTQYLPKEQNYCVYAEYEKLKKKSFWGYSIQVHNHAQEQDGTVHDSGTLLCAKQADDTDPAKLEVAPCFLPSFAAGPYWVVAYDEALGYALVSGGQPTVKTENGCKTGSGLNDAGLWIFTREQVADPELVQQVRSIATQQGFDVTVLNAVDQSNCADQA